MFYRNAPLHVMLLDWAPPPPPVATILSNTDNDAVNIETRSASKAEKVVFIVCICSWIQSKEIFLRL